MVKMLLSVEVEPAESVPRLMAKSSIWKEK